MRTFYKIGGYIGYVAIVAGLAYMYGYWWEARAQRLQWWADYEAQYGAEATYQLYESMK